MRAITKTERRYMLEAGVYTVTFKTTNFWLTKSRLQKLVTGGRTPLNMYMKG